MLNGRDAAVAAAVPINCTSRHDTDTDTAGMYGPRPRPIHTHPVNGPLSRTIRVSRYQKGKTNLDFTEARDSEWQWHQLGHTQVCTSIQTDNHASTPPLSFLQAGCSSRRPTNSIKALKALLGLYTWVRIHRNCPKLYPKTCFEIILRQKLMS